MIEEVDASHTSQQSRQSNMRRGTPKTKSEKAPNRLQSAKRMVTQTNMAAQGKNCSQMNTHLEKNVSSTK